MSPRLAIALLVALAAAPPTYAALVYAWQLSDVLALAVRLMALMGPMTPAFWLQVASLSLQLVGISVALFVVARMTLQARWAVAALALAGAWGVAAPVLMRLLDLR